MSAKNILHLRSTSGHGGGADQVIFNIINNWHTPEFKHTICFIKPESVQDYPIAHRAKEQSISFIELSYRGKIDLKAVKHLELLLTQYHIDILHTHDYKADIIGYFATRHTGISRVSTAHGWIENNWKDKIYNHLDVMALRSFPAVIAVSTPIYNRLTSSRISSDRLTYIPNSVVPAYFDSDKELGSQCRKQLNISSSSILIGCFGRFSHEKGQMLLIEALHKIIPQHPNIHGLLIGEGPDKDSLVQRVKDLNLQEHIHFIGFQDNIIPFYAATDLMVVPSLTEGLALVILEALAMDIPVLATAVGGTPSIIKHKTTGYLIPPGNVDSLIQGINEYIENPTPFIEYAHQGKAYVLKHHHIDIALDQLNRIYKSL